MVLLVAAGLFVQSLTQAHQRHAWRRHRSRCRRPRHAAGLALPAGAVPRGVRAPAHRAARRRAERRSGGGHDLPAGRRRRLRPRPRVPGRELARAAGRSRRRRHVDGRLAGLLPHARHPAQVRAACFTDRDSEHRHTRDHRQRELRAADVRRRAIRLGIASVRGATRTGFARSSAWSRTCRSTASPIAAAASCTFPHAQDSWGLLTVTVRAATGSPDSARRDAAPRGGRRSIPIWRWRASARCRSSRASRSRASA